MSEENVSTESKLMPPYGPVTRMKYIIDLLSNHTFPKISSSDLKSRGFSGSDAAKTVLGLKFLGIIDKEGNKTELMAKLQLVGDQHKSIMEDMVRTAYKLLFEQVNEPNKLQRDDLINDFMQIYHCSKFQAEPAVPNFLWLCNESGLETAVQTDVVERKRVINIRTQKVNVREKEQPLDNGKPAKSLSSDNFLPDLIELGDFKIYFPSSWDLKKTRQAIVNGDFKLVYRELEKLADKLKIG